MGILSSILGFCGFGVGTSIGIVIGYYMFIYFEPTDVKVSVFLLSFFVFSHVFSVVLHFLGFVWSESCLLRFHVGQQCLFAMC
jgi:hypothetical protein